MDGTVLLAVTFGWALVPFMLSVIYGCTKAGAHKIAPMGDILAVVVGIIGFAVLSTVLRNTLADTALPRHWGAFFSAIIGQLGLLIGVSLTYKILYAGKPKVEAAH